MGRRFEGKSIIITGSSSGIGQAALLAFAKEGASVVVHGTNAQRIEKTVHLLKEAGIDESKFLVVEGEIQKEETLQKLITKTLKKFGKIDVLINNAGIVSAKGESENTIKNFDEVMAVNLRAPFRLIELALPHLKETKGNIINISSVAAFMSAVAIVSSESTNTFKWVFQFMKSNQFCEGEWCPVELMADNSRAIAAAAAIVFPRARKRSCFYHVIAACNKKFIALHLSKSETDAIKNEIYKLAYCSSEEHFDILAAAIIDEWQLSENENVVEFAEYFLRQYVQIDKFWFAANGGGCRTDNGIEACNHWMKDVFITKSLPIMQAADTIKLYLKQSNEKNYGPEEFEIVVTNAEWVAAYDFKKKTKVLHNTVKNCYYVRRSDSQFTDPEFFDFLNSMDMIEWDDEDVQNFNENVAVVTPSLLYDNQFTCNCPIGARRKLCKHILIIEVALKKRHFPDVAPMRQYLNEAGRNKRGRPRKFTPALAK